VAIVILNQWIKDSQKPAIRMAVGDSPFLMEVLYDQGSKQMTVTMKGGGQYVYSGVMPDVMQAFQESRSKSEFYSKQIRGQYESSRILTKTIGKKSTKKA